MGKQAPGKIMMKCMIWENNPISIRPAQDYGVVYNSTTIQKLPDSIQNQLQTLNDAPYGIYLKQKYVYRDTFLLIKGEILDSDKADMNAENGLPLFDSDGSPTYPYTYHQMFVLSGSLFSGKIVSQTDITDANAYANDNSVSKWDTKEQPVSFDHDGHWYDTNDGTNLHDYIPELNTQTNDPQIVSKLQASSLPQQTQAYILSRKTWRFMPMQIATSSEYKNTSTTITQPLQSGIHWLCTKVTPLYSGEDFFVEFFKLGEPDIVSSALAMLPVYAPLDSSYVTVNAGTGTVTVNGGVVELQDDGSVAYGSRETFNLNNQPYYYIEIGSGDANHNYIILLAYNTFPILIQVGKFPCVAIGSVSPANNPGNATTTAPQVIYPTTNVSRRLSTYRDVACKDLMSQESLRITVREHLGKLVIVFKGHEDNPWIISRTDLVVTPPPTSSSSSAPAGIDEVPEAMAISNTTMKIGAGNMKCGFLFAPLIYENIVSFKQPDYVTVKGPVQTTDINLLLGDQTVQNPTLIGNPKQKASANQMRYFQDAENYFEIIAGKSAGREKKNTNPIQPTKDYGKDTFAITQDVRNAEDEQISYIAVAMASPLTPYGPTTGMSTSSGVSNSYISWMNIQYTLRAGDATVYAADENDPAEEDIVPWRIWNCITPVATGWRLYVQQSEDGQDQTPVDVGGFVEHFSHSWTYSDNAKLDHTGSIRFRINAGTPTSLAGSLSPTPTGSGDNSNADLASYLCGLSDKMFFLRVYAWWVGGYMDCNIGGCPCRSPGNANAGSTPDAPNIIFTGLAFGGEITVEGQLRYMECQLFDYMKIISDQFFLNSPFFDGMSDYHAVAKVAELCGFRTEPDDIDPYPPALMIDDIMAQVSSNSSKPFVIPYYATGEQIFCVPYVLPSSYDTLQNPYMKFADGSKYDEALSKIGAIAGKVVYVDRFGTIRYDIRPDSLFAWNNSDGAPTTLAQAARTPKCNFSASPWALASCSHLDLLAFETYTYKKAVGDMVNDILLLTTTPQGELLINSVVNFPGRYDPTQPGYIGYTKRLLQMDGIFGSEAALQQVTNYYASVMFKPPVVLSWKSMGMANLKAMDIVTFTGLIDDLGFPPQNVDDTSLPRTTITVIVTSLTSEITITAEKQDWMNSYEGEWLYGNITMQ